MVACMILHHSPSPGARPALPQKKASAPAATAAMLQACSVGPAPSRCAAMLQSCSRSCSAEDTILDGIRPHSAEALSPAVQSLMELPGTETLLDLKERLGALATWNTSLRK